MTKEDMRNRLKRLDNNDDRIIGMQRCVNFITGRPPGEMLDVLVDFIAMPKISGFDPPTYLRLEAGGELAQALVRFLNDNLTKMKEENALLLTPGGNP